MAKDNHLRPQDVLQGYWLGDKLGVGARTVIYEVKRRDDGRIFAAKVVIVRNEDDKRVLRHLENEYEVLTDIQQQRTSGVHIAVRALEFERIRKWFRTRAAYLIMERLEGRPLSDERDYTLDQVLTIFRQVCLGIENTHKAGYVHADLKPQNILVGEHLDVKLIDFGFAARIGSELSSYKGTFGYLAPEQAGGRVTERTDVFNLGAALYWALTGQNLPSIMPGKHEEIGFVPDEGVPITPPTRLNPEVPRELSDVILRCCEYEPARRPTATELKRYLHGLQLRMEYGAV